MTILLRAEAFTKCPRWSKSTVPSHSLDDDGLQELVHHGNGHY